MGLGASRFLQKGRSLRVPAEHSTRYQSRAKRKGSLAHVVAGKILRRCDRYPPLEGVRDPWGSEHAELCEAEHA